MFEVLGLTPAEEMLWQGLVDRPPATVDELGSDADTLLASLVAKGLVVRLSGSPVRYTATAPDLALDLLVRAREQELRSARLRSGELLHRFLSTRQVAEDALEIVRGTDAVLHRWRQVHHAARAELCGLHRPPYRLVDKPATGVHFRSVYDPSALDEPGMLDVIGDQGARIGAVPVKVLLADDRIGVISLQADETVLVVRASSLLTALRTLFDRIWFAAVPVLAEAADQVNHRLLTCLAAGMTDQAIARQFGWHLRTVQRRVRGIMAELGVRTRFQAGLHAARRGWL